LCDPADADALFTPLQDNDLNPFVTERARLNLAYTFFESPLGPNAAQNAARFDVVFGGSTWCLDRMRERGITNARLLCSGSTAKSFDRCPASATARFAFFSGANRVAERSDLVIRCVRRVRESAPRPTPHWCAHGSNPWGEADLGEIGQLACTCCFEGVEREGAYDQTEAFLEAAYGERCAEGIHDAASSSLSANLARGNCGDRCGLFPNRSKAAPNLG
jgi:hypothetical protein